MIKFPEATRIAAGKAADWLEANRDRHIVGALALDSRGATVAPSNPDAQCFCALGRFAVEAGINLSTVINDEPDVTYDPLNDVLKDEETGASFVTEIYTANDEHHCGTGPVPDSILAGKQGIEILRKVQNGEDI